MELGISPIVTSSMFMQVLGNAKFIDVDFSNRDDVIAFQGCSKIVGLLITFGQALCYVLSGMYGPVAQIGYGTSLLLVMQLCMAGLCVITLDDMLAKG